MTSESDVVSAALAAWESAATAAHGGSALARPLLTTARLISAGHRLAELLQARASGEESPS